METLASQNIMKCKNKCLTQSNNKVLMAVESIDHQKEALT